ncbi:hypothetical protein HAX54_049998, partial [Datura stramonium]|nr:hypothetical protein [Datura stramonium]
FRSKPRLGIFVAGGSTGDQPVKASVRVTRQWVKRTTVPAVKVSPDDYLLTMEKWGVGRDERTSRGAVLAVTDVGAWEASWAFQWMAELEDYCMPPSGRLLGLWRLMGRPGRLRRSDYDR